MVFRPFVQSSICSDETSNAQPFDAKYYARTEIH